MANLLESAEMMECLSVVEMGLYTGWRVEGGRRR